MKNYILLYGDKKPEDNICITNMFQNVKQIHLGWTDFDHSYNMKIIEEAVQNGIEQIIISGFEIGWDKMVKETKQKYPELKIKVICNTQDSLLYYEYERENFFKLLELSKQGLIQNIAFLRKGQYETYKTLGYKCSYLKENYILEESKKVKIKTKEVSLLEVKEMDYLYKMGYEQTKRFF